MRCQLPNQRLPRRLRNVASHRAFVAVGTQVVSRLGCFIAVVILQKRRPPGPRVITGAGAFDLDDISAKVSQRLGTPGAREHAGEVKDADAV